MTRRPNLREDLCTLMTLSREISLKMRKVSDKFCRENHTFYSENILSQNRAVYEIVW
jgi:hypothetical protein